MVGKRKTLGRGLDALLSPSSRDKREAADSGELRHLPIDLLQRGKYQPRHDMRPESLQDLADSIKAQGVVQPIVVRPIKSAPGQPKRYEIIAGERRWRASQMAGLQEMPAVIRDVPDQAAVAMALIENIQRENLNPLEEAQALTRLITEFEMTHQQAADAVGRSRAAVSNLLRLLELADEVKAMVEERRLEMGHARALLTLPAALAIALAQTAAAEQLSVREVERRVQQAGKAKPPAKSGAAPARSNADIETLEREIADLLGAKVQLNHGRKGSGKLEEYMGCKITRKGKHSLKFTQPVLIQSLSDKFELPNGRYTTPAMAGDVLTKCKEKDMMEAQQQTIYRSGTGKLMHMMQYSQPEVYNCVWDQARHMGRFQKETHEG